MKQYSYKIIFLIVLFLIQVAALKVFPGASVWFPQLVLLTVIAFALNHSLPEVVWFSFLSGVLGELFSTYFFGSWIIGFLITGPLIYFVTKRFTAREVSFAMMVILVVPATLLFPIWVYLYNLLMVVAQIGDPVEFRDIYAVTILWTAASNLIFLYPINLFFRFINQRS